jgi:hypothetical protein
MGQTGSLPHALIAAYNSFGQNGARQNVTLDENTTCITVFDARQLKNSL